MSPLPQQKKILIKKKKPVIPAQAGIFYRYKQQAFTLIELVVGIVVMAIALTLMSTVFFGSAGRSVEPMIQIRAAEFGQALMDEIIAKKFDELTPDGGVPPCSPCTPVAGLGADGVETRPIYDDVDDYNAYCAATQSLMDSQGNTPGSGMAQDFDRFTMQVCVVYDGNYDGTADAAQSNAKLITVDIFAPSAGGGLEQIRFRAYRSNF